MCFLVGISLSCNRAKQIDWSAVYVEASEKADRGESGSALQLADQGFRSTEQGTVLNYKFRLLKTQATAFANPHEALEFLKTSPPAGPDSEELEIKRRTIQAIAYSVSGDLHAAQDCLDEAMKSSEASHPAMLARIFLARAFLAFLQRDQAAMEKYYRKGADLAHTFKQPHAEVDALIGIAYLEMDHEQYDKAIADLTKALEQSRATGYARAEELILGKLGWSYYQTGDSDRAASSLNKAESLAAAMGQKSDQTLWLIDLGDIYLAAENYDEAEKSYSKAESLATGIQDKKDIVLAFHNLALVELDKGNVEKAEEYNRQALAADRGVSNLYLQSLCSLTTAELALRHRDFSKAENLLQSIAKTNKDSSLVWQAHSDLATAFVDESKPIYADREFQAAIRTVETARSAIKEEERRMSILDASPFYDDYIHFLIHQHNGKKALQIAEFSRARTLADGLGIAGPKAAELSVQRIQGSLKNENQCVLAYWLAKDESYLWVIKQSEVRYFVLPAQQEIDTEIEKYSDKLLRHQGIEDSEDGQKLYELLVRPAESLIPRGSRVTIIPNRSLYKLNFESLVVPGKKPHYWIEDVTVETGESMALLAASGRRSAAALKELLLIGAPAEADKDFPLLHHADEEIQRVEDAFPRSQEQVVSGKDATPDAYGSHQPNQFRLIHFVTHGTASQTSPLDSAIILSPQADSGFKLYARDIMKTPLNAEVVTISACYGAGAKTYSGEGLVGLAWAFLRAGAHQVIAALWEVDDRATPDLMDHFYKALKHENAAAALRKAKLEMVHSTTVYRLPYYWASLQLYAGS